MIETERLTLRPFTLADAARVQLLAGEREIAATTLSIPHPYEDGVAEGWISAQKERIERGELACFAIVTKEDNVLIGSIGLTIQAWARRAELGYWIGKPYWGRGYGTEAAMAIISYGFGRLDLNRIYACHFARNPASGRVMQKIGMKYEGCRRQHVVKWGGYEDIVDYGMLRSDYDAR